MLRQFVSEANISNLNLVEGVTVQNLPFLERALTKIGSLGEEIVCNVLSFNDVRIVYIAGNTLSVGLRAGRTANGQVGDWEILSEQIVRIIEKAFDEFGESDG